MSIAEKRYSLKVENFSRLSQIYSQKNWDKVDSTGLDEFNRFCQMLEYFDDELQEFLLELADQFLRVGIADYIRYFIIALQKCLVEEQEHETLYIVPLKAEEDIGKPKSSDALYYQIKCNIFGIQTRFPNIRFKFVPNYDAIPREETNGLICLVDDFIGTAETALSAKDYLIAKGAKDFVYISLVSQKQGLEFIRQAGYRVYTAIERLKGITDAEKESSEIAIDIARMNRIETVVKPNRANSFGFKQSEALVKMDRTPNNTFPVFWLQSRDGLPVVPFPR